MGCPRLALSSLIELPTPNRPYQISINIKYIPHGEGGRVVGPRRGRPVPVCRSIVAGQCRSRMSMPSEIWKGREGAAVRGGRESALVAAKRERGEWRFDRRMCGWRPERQWRREWVGGFGRRKGVAKVQGYDAAASGWWRGTVTGTCR